MHECVGISSSSVFPAPRGSQQEVVNLTELSKKRQLTNQNSLFQSHAKIEPNHANILSAGDDGRKTAFPTTFSAGLKGFMTEKILR